MGSAITLLVMYGWLPAVLYIFSRYPAQRAMVISFVVAWLFLPQAVITLPSVPDWTKMSATCYSVMIATFIHDSSRITSFKPSWIDIPMALWCVSPFFASVTNDLGAYDGFSASLDQAMTWGMPYFLGRIYLCNFEGMRKLAVATFVGGLVYIPLCLYEARMFTSLHQQIYGFITFDFGQALRMGGYRPSVFMTHGLAVGVWMMTAALMGIVLWRCKVMTKLWNVKISVWVWILLVVFVLIRSTGAYNLLAFALIILFMAKWLRTSILVWVFVALIGVYLNLGVSGNFPRQEIISAMSQVFDQDRIQSLEFRFLNEEILGERARLRSTFGWGGFGRNRVFDEYGKDISVTDSLWVIVFGTAGVFGLTSLMTALLLPVIAFCVRFPARLWSNAIVAPAAALNVGLLMYALDCVLNAMINPVYALICGGIAGLVLNPRPNADLKKS
jgi:hypothetical protein